VNAFLILVLNFFQPTLPSSETLEALSSKNLSSRALDKVSGKLDTQIYKKIFFAISNH